MAEKDRLASDVLLSLESKIDNILGLLQTLDLNQKILSNKLNALSASLTKKEAVKVTPKIIAEAIERLPIPIPEVAPPAPPPNTFRKTSRVDTMKPIDVQPPSKPSSDNVFVVQKPEPPKPEVVTNTVKENIKHSTASTVPVTQRVMDPNGKSVYLAQVEILNAETNEFITKTKTNGVGKWATPLLPGNYKVTIYKGIGITSDKMVLNQTIVVKESTIPLELLPVVIK